LGSNVLKRLVLEEKLGPKPADQIRLDQGVGGKGEQTEDVFVQGTDNNLRDPIWKGTGAGERRFVN